MHSIAFWVVSENFDSAYFAGFRWANDFDSLAAIVRRLNEFERLYNESPAPISTGWSTSDSKH